MCRVPYLLSFSTGKQCRACWSTKVDVATQQLMLAGMRADAGASTEVGAGTEAGTGNGTMTGTATATGNTLGAGNSGNFNGATSHSTVQVGLGRLLGRAFPAGETITGFAQVQAETQGTFVKPPQ